MVPHLTWQRIRLHDNRSHSTTRAMLRRVSAIVAMPVKVIELREVL